MAATCLSFHASYRCQHAGACCDAAWDIEVDAPIVAAVSIGRLKAVSVTGAPFVQQQDEAGRSFVAPARTADGMCGFRHDARCSLQRAGGPSMLPTACRHFPRVYRREPHGDRLTLSHFCPTAAGLLFDSSPVRIVPASAPLALDFATEGLDVRTALPPLLRPAMLMDHQGYDAWEASVVAVFSDAGSVEDAFATIVAATERIRRWHPSDGPLDAAVRQGFVGPLPRFDVDRFSRGFEIVRRVTGDHPLLTIPSDALPLWRSARSSHDAILDAPLRRYLAACAFGNWVAYRGRGLRSIVEWLLACYDVFRVQVTRELQRGGTRGHDTVLRAFRNSDFLMVHTVDSLAFARAAASIE